MEKRNKCKAYSMIFATVKITSFKLKVGAKTIIASVYEKSNFAFCLNFRYLLM